MVGLQIFNHSKWNFIVKLAPLLIKADSASIKLFRTSEKGEYVWLILITDVDDRTKYGPVSIFFFWIPVGMCLEANCVTSQFLIDLD